MKLLILDILKKFYNEDVNDFPNLIKTLTDEQLSYIYLNTDFDSGNINTTGESDAVEIKIYNIIHEELRSRGFINRK